MNKLLLLSSFLFFNTLLIGQSYFVAYDSTAQIIYEDIIDLKLVDAQLKLEKMRKEQPYNLASLHLENYLDFFTLFIEEDLDKFELLQKNKKKRLAAFKKHLKDSDPYKRFCIAEIKLQWALARSKFGQLFKASREIYTAYHLLKENEKQHPSFIYNKKSLSIIHSLVETITLPGFVKKLLGLDGSITLGLNEINKVIEYSHNNSFIFNMEADAIKTFILFFQANKEQEAWDFLQQSRLNSKKSLLSTFLIAKIAQRIGFNEVAIQTLKNKPIGSEYSEFHFLDFQLGLSQLRQLDTISIESFHKYLENFSGQHYIKEAYQKLAWSALVFHGDKSKYNYYMELARNKGAKLLDDDKQAYKESRSKVVPHVDLLKARLLFDGGYFQKAYDFLSNNEDDFSRNSKFHLEFNYRLARAAQKIGLEDDSIALFSYILNIGRTSKSYYACNSALQLGLINEKKNEVAFAKKYYEICLSLSPQEYKNSLHQKAKTGLKRLEMVK